MKRWWLSLLLILLSVPVFAANPQLTPGGSAVTCTTVYTSYTNSKTFVVLTAAGSDVTSQFSLVNEVSGTCSLKAASSAVVANNYKLYYYDFSADSFYTCPVDVISSSPAAPSPPAGFAGQAVSPGLAWTWYASSGAASYSIYRAAASGAESLLQAGLTALNFTDTTGTAGTKYF